MHPCCTQQGALRPLAVWGKSCQNVDLQEEARGGQRGLEQRKQSKSRKGAQEGEGAMSGELCHHTDRNREEQMREGGGGYMERKRKKKIKQRGLWVERSVGV